MLPSEIPSALAVAVDAARQAGAIIRQRFPASANDPRLGIRNKGRINLVTEVDLACEQLIRRVILERFPDHRVLGEEEGAGPNEDRATEPLWIVDPLDGTAGFAHGYPFVGVSIGLEVSASMVLGVVYDPLHDELFEAQRGQGARLNGASIKVSATPNLEQALIVSGFPYQLGDFDNEAFFGLFRELVCQSGGFRRDGAAALDFCYVACGRTDAFWEFFLAPWDSAAGSLILTEAGGVITDLGGGPFDLRRPEMLASNGILHPSIIELARPYLPGIRPHLPREAPWSVDPGP